MAKIFTRRLLLILTAVIIAITALLLYVFLWREQPAVFTGPVEPQDMYRTYYEIYVGAFYDSNGDGIGDLAGVSEKMDYINDNRAGSATSLHATGIWLMPIFPSPTYHKYDATDYYSIDPQFGTMEDFTRLAASCDERGISLILDLVLNHTSNEHPWFQSAIASIGIEPCGQTVCTVDVLCREHNKYCDWYNFTNEATLSWHNVPNAQGWTYEGPFWSGMPDLNLDNAEVREEILNICDYWLAAGADGFRLDAVTSFYTGNASQNTEFLAWLQSSLGDEVYLVAEAWSDARTIESMYNSQLTSYFNFPFSNLQGEIMNTLRASAGATLAVRLQLWQDTIKARNPNAIDAVFLTNHDIARSSDMLRGDLVQQKQAAAIYLLMPGNPFIYYGEEIGMSGGSNNDESKRTPMVWSNDDATGMAQPQAVAEVRPVSKAVDKQLKDKNSLLRFYIDVINVRNKYPAIARGTVEALNTGNTAIMAYSVSYEDKLLIILHNFSGETVKYEESSDGGTVLLEKLAAGGKAPSYKNGEATLPAYSTLILERYTELVKPD